MKPTAYDVPETSFDASLRMYKHLRHTTTENMTTMGKVDLMIIVEGLLIKYFICCEASVLH